MAISVIINQIIVLFLLMGLGIALVKLKVLEKLICEKLTWLLCYVVMPCLIFNSFQLQFTPALWHNFQLMAAISAGIHIVYIGLSKLLLNGQRLKQQAVAAQMQYAAVYSNCGFMGIPLVMALVGSQGAFYGSVYIAVNSVFVWTHGVLIYFGSFDRRSIRHALFNSNTIASTLGTICFIFSIKIPLPIHSAIDAVGRMNTALAMILVGSAMAGVNIFQIWRSTNAWISVLMRNLLFPTVILCGLFALHIQGDLLVVAMALCACPVGGMIVLFAQLTGSNTELPVKSLVLSTLVSIVTLPIMLTLSLM